MERHFEINDTIKQITVSYRSIEDERAPLQPHMIRSESPHTMWRFTIVSDESESNEVEEESKDKCSNTTSSQFSISTKSKSTSFVYRTLSSLKKKLHHLWQGVKSIFVRKSVSAKPETKPSLQTVDMIKDAMEQNCTCEKIYKKSYSTKRKSNRSWTYVEVETVVDSKGMIPIWFINYMQR